MSIELDNPKTALEKADAAANFVAQMNLAYRTRNYDKFREAHGKAARLLHELTRMLDKDI